MAAAAVRGNHDERNAGSVTEEIKRLDIAGVIVAATFIHGDEDRGALPEFLVVLDGIDDLLDVAFEEIELR